MSIVFEIFQSRGCLAKMNNAIIRDIIAVKKIKNDFTSIRQKPGKVNELAGGKGIST